MRKPRLLLLSYAFPPATAPEAMLSAKRAANLKGWEVEVIAAAPFHPGHGNDTEMADWVEQRVAAVHRLTPSIRLPFHRLGPIAHLPDPMRLLNRQAVRLARALHRSRPFDAILSWSTYHSVHLAALELKKSLGIPWLAHMSDPWVDNPFVTYAGATGALNRFYERAVIGGCDRVLFTTPETVDLVMAKYPADWRSRAVVIPHGFDPSLYAGQEPPLRDGRPLVVRYLGNFYGVRSPEPLFRALAAILASAPETIEDVRFEIVGRLDAGMSETPAARALPQGLVVTEPPVGYARSLEMMETADLLLIVDAPARLSVFLPSKLVDYLGSGRPIVSLTPPGASRRVTEEVGFWAADPQDLQGCAEALMQGLAAVRSGTALSADVSAYSASATGKALCAVLAEVMQEHPGALPALRSRG